MGLGDKKQFLVVDGRPMLERTITRLASSHAIGTFVVAVAPEDCDRVAQLLDGLGRLIIVRGGATRQESVFNALDALPPSCRWVLVHDAARPWVEPALVSRVLAAAMETGAAIPAVEATDTIKIVDDCGMVRETLSRQGVHLVQTPQAFDRRILELAHRRARDEGWVATDDASLVEAGGHAVRVVPGLRSNIKVTWESDLTGWPAGCAPRVGFGYDAHRFDPSRDLYLGGVLIPGYPGLAGHSDADVLLHAVIDALLGAAALGDIGHHFPPGAPDLKGVSSGVLARRTVALLAASGWQPAAVDVTVIAERPRLAPHRERMVSSVASLVGLDPSRVSVKATTTEGMGFTGRGEGIVAYSVATIHGGEAS